MSARTPVGTASDQPALPHMAVLVVLSFLGLVASAVKDVGAVDGVEVAVQVFLTAKEPIHQTPGLPTGEPRCG